MAKRLTAQQAKFKARFSKPKAKVAKKPKMPASLARKLGRKP